MAPAVERVPANAAALVMGCGLAGFVAEVRTDWVGKPWVWDAVQKVHSASPDSLRGGGRKDSDVTHRAYSEFIRVFLTELLERI